MTHFRPTNLIGLLRNQSTLTGDATCIATRQCKALTFEWQWNIAIAELRFEATRVTSECSQITPNWNHRGEAMREMSCYNLIVGPIITCHSYIFTPSLLFAATRTRSAPSGQINCMTKDASICLVLSCLVLSCLVLSCLMYWPTLLWFSIQNRPLGSSSNHSPNPLNTPSDPPTAANRLNLPKNRKHKAACCRRIVWNIDDILQQLTTLNASRCCIHTSDRLSCCYKSCKHGIRRSEICWMWLNSWAETIIYPAKHHYRPSSVHQFPTKTANSCKCSLQSYELWKDPDYRHISSDFMQSKVGWVVPLTLYLVCHRQSAKGFTIQWSFQQIKKVILHASWR